MPASSSKSSPLRAPLLTGLAAAIGLVVAAGAFAWLAGGAPEPVTASTEIDLSAAIAASSPSTDDPFGDSTGEDVTLPGVVDTADALSASPEPALEPSQPDVRRSAPYAGYYEPGPGGPLPRIGDDGRRPEQVYARQFDGVEDAPTIAIVVGGLGLSESVTRRAIRTLPADITLSFAPYGDNLQDWVDEARADGHEVLIELPMEPFDYPNNDPGPHTLLVDAAPEENDRRLLSLLSRAAGYVGIANYLGARLGSDVTMMSHIFSRLEDRGLTIVHDGAGRRNTVLGAAAGANARLNMVDRVVDGNPSPEAIDERLFELEALALQNGNALGSGFAYPSTIDTVAVWAQDLASRGYQLAPVSFLSTLRNGEPVARAAVAPDGDNPYRATNYGAAEDAGQGQ